MSSFPLRITSDAFEALSADAQAEILRVLEPHNSRAAAAGGAAIPPGAPERPPPLSRIFTANPAAEATTSPRYEVWRQGSLGESLAPRRLDFEPAAAILGVTLAAGAPGDELEEDNEEHTPAPPSPVGTPSGSPGPLRPMWRTGSCGEAGPFIGLGYGWTCELARRMDRWPDVDAFHLKHQMFADLAEEPDLLRDFTEQEVIDGMAHYSWSAVRTREMLGHLRAQRDAERAPSE